MVDWGVSRMALRDDEELQYCLFAAPPPPWKIVIYVPASDRFPARLAFESLSLLIMRIASLVAALVSGRF